MKILNCSALSKVNPSELSIFLLWLAGRQPGKMTLRQVTETAPIRSLKLSSIFKILTTFELATFTQTHVIITPAGVAYAKTTEVERIEMMRKLLWPYSQTQITFNLLDSKAAFVRKSALHEALSTDEGKRVSSEDLQGFIDWAQWSGLFRYDRKREIITLAPPELGRHTSI
jgi:hypothetical protein